MQTYFDYCATSQPNIKIIQRILKKHDSKFLFGNPSSTHYEGIIAYGLLLEAREKIASILKVKDNEIIFTSGGSESDNMAINGVMLQFEPSEAEMITSRFEHPAVLQACRHLEFMGYKVHYVEPTSKGIIKYEDIDKYINKKTKLVSIMAVNNELGTIQNINYIGKRLKSKKIIFHSDCVQGIGLYKLDLTNIDLASFSGHKFGGLKQSGFLYKSKDCKIKPLIRGGGQEFGLRAGTENVFANLVMADCLEETIKKWRNARTRGEIHHALRSLELSLLKEFPGKVISNSDVQYRVDNCLNIAFKDIDASNLQHLLSEDKVMISTGSACHSSIDEPSHVLQSINVPYTYIKGAIRISCGYDTTQSDIESLQRKIIKHVKEIYKNKLDI